jgi:ferric-dicitrate binding protein FerR (iron transport regulator)
VEPEKLAQLLKKYQKGICTEKELETLYEWYENLNNSTPDVVFKDENHRLSVKQNILTNIRKKVENKKDRRISDIHPFYQNKFWRNMAAGFILLAATVVIGLRLQSHSQLAVYISEKTDSGKMKELLLTDGTKVYLNAKSELRFPQTFNQDTREVFLNGEAYFEVAKNPEKPFIIHSTKLETKVLGTHFNIKAYSDDATEEVTVLEGKVSVKDSKTDVILLPNQKAVYDTSAHSLNAFTITNSNDYKAWTEKKLVFSGLRLEEIVLILSRRYNQPIHIATKSLAKCQITTHFEDVPLEKVLTILCAYTGSTYRKTDTGIVLNGKGCN